MVFGSGKINFSVIRSKNALRLPYSHDKSRQGMLLQANLCKYGINIRQLLYLNYFEVNGETKPRIEKRK